MNMKSLLPSTFTAAEFLSIPHFLVSVLEMHIKAGDGNVPHGRLHLHSFSLRDVPLLLIRLHSQPT